MRQSIGSPLPLRKKPRFTSPQKTYLRKIWSENKSPKGRPVTLRELGRRTGFSHVTIRSAIKADDTISYSVFEAILEKGYSMSKKEIKKTWADLDWKFKEMAVEDVLGDEYQYMLTRSRFSHSPSFRYSENTLKIYLHPSSHLQKEGMLSERANSAYQLKLNTDGKYMDIDSLVESLSYYSEGKWKEMGLDLFLCKLNLGKDPFMKYLGEILYEETMAERSMSL